MYEVNKCQTNNNNWVFNLFGNYFCEKKSLQYIFGSFVFFVNTLPTYWYPVSSNFICHTVWLSEFIWFSMVLYSWCHIIVFLPSEHWITRCMQLVLVWLVMRVPAMCPGLTLHWCLHGEGIWHVCLCVCVCVRVCVCVCVHVHVCVHSIM